MTSTENAVETVAEVAATDEAAVAAAVAEEVAAGSPVVVSAHIDEVTLEDVPHEFGTADASVVEEDPVAAVESIDAVAVVEEHTVEEHVVEEHEVEEHKVEEHVVPEHVVEEPVVPEPFVEENTSEVALVETDEVAEEQSPVVEEFASQAEPAEIADAPVESSDLPTAQFVDEHAQPVETTDVVVTEDAPAIDAIEVVAEDAPADEMTNVVIEDATASAAPPEHNEAPDEQIADLSEDDDSVTGASNEADNSDAEPTR
jgi:hypothetical protein